MIPITSQWQDAIENIYRNPAYFKFKWFLEPSEVYNGKVTVVSNKVEESYSTNYSPVTAVIDANISEDNVASTEEGRWILDGSNVSTYIGATGLLRIDLSSYSSFSSFRISTTNRIQIYEIYVSNM